jgi:hypothetical protein
VIRSRVAIKAWLEQTPSVEAVRPTHCAGCAAPGRPLSGCLILHGQGLQRRQLRGVLDEDGDAGVFELSVRKYECQACGAVMTVVPRGVLPGRLYTGPSIALALWLWLVTGLRDVAVRARVCGWRIAGADGGRGWAQLYRWVRGASRLFELPRPMPASESVRQTAQRIVMTLSGLAPVAITPMSSRVFAGAAIWA